ncbi:Receptor-like protein kinase HSL1 [Vitis vinifera]|uniref:non-specific serine/threonine protein kinase n=1 Tax=Vitis vinifera TaxID=29760 RepID=A0A438F893_VITVI|nr:Receptor-like protein kinase HSL1 [Vitis vinifera]
MSASNAFRWNLCLLCLLCLVCLPSGVTSDEIQLLLKVKAELQNFDTDVFDSWESNDSACNFRGITCNSDGRVREIELSNQRLSGIVPLESICQLESLEKLSLGANFLQGTISGDLNKCVGLQYLDLGNNLFTGPLPDFSSLSGLKHLYLNSSGFSGLFPWKSLQNIINGTLPPEIGNLNKLINLELSDNYLSGEIPAEIGKLSKLWQLELYANELTGKSLGRPIGVEATGEPITLLQQLSGPIPQKLGSWADFDYIDVSENSLTGPIPPDMCKNGKMKELLMLQNKFTGEIPVTYASCSTLTRFRVVWGIASGDFKSSSLVSIDLSNNQFSREIPATIGELKTWAEPSRPVPQSVNWTRASISFHRGLQRQLRGKCWPLQPQYQFLPAVSTGFPHIEGAADAHSLFHHRFMVLLGSLAGFFLESKEKDDRSLKDDSWDVKSFHMLSFTEDEILNSIKQENLIGKGGCGNVYKVSLSNGNELAVKHIWNSDSGGRKTTRSTAPMLAKRSGKSSEFDAEVQTLSSIRHVNVVKLYCSITSEDSSLLVYEYLPMGVCGIVSTLPGRWSLIGRQANGGGKDSTHVIAGTHGYIAPEYGYTYKVNEKSDVYSFGVVLMELVTGKRPIEPDYGENRDIVSWVCSNIKTRESVLSIVDSRIPEALKEDAVKVLRIAILCTARLPALRPTMRGVVQMIEEAEPCRLVGIIVNKDGVTKKWKAKQRNSIQAPNCF